MKYRLTHNQTVRGIQVVNHILALIGVAWVVYSSNYSYLLIATLGYWFIGILGINIGFHRLLTHRSFKTSMPIEVFLSFIGVITTVGSPMAWVAIHRQHHKFTEITGDPHSPYLIGNFRAWFGFWDIKQLNLRLVHDIRKSRIQKFYHDYYNWILITYCILLALLDPWLVIFVYALPACLCLHSSSAIIVIAHRHGYKTHDLGIDQARNSWIANLITMGEGWHNNHHAKPYAWSNSEKWWEWDIPALIIKLIKIK